jgi:hypothetical protein
MNTMNAGVARVDITPVVGTWLQGYTREKGSEGIFERLYAKALAFESGTKKSVLITSDLVGVSPGITLNVRKGIMKKIKGIEAENIMVSATHTHCGPAILDNLCDGSVINKKYVQTLTEKLIGIAVKAWKDREPVKLGVGTGKAYFNINRRLPIPEGIGFMPNPKGPCDHEVGVIRIDNLEKKPKAIVMNFSCHPTVWGEQLISPDYPGLAQKAVEKAFKGVTALSTTGACGDIRPCFVKGPKAKTFGGGKPEFVVKAGNELAREVIRVARKIKTRANEELGSISETIKLPLSKPLSISALKKEIVTQAEKIKRMKKEKESSLIIVWEKSGLDWAKRTLKLIETKKFNPWVMGEIQLLNIGGIYLVGLPGEIMCEIGFAIKKHFKPRKSFISAYTNGCIGYVPTPQALIEGGYEPNDSIKGFNLPARFSPKVQNVIEKTVARLHKKM